MRSMLADQRDHLGQAPAVGGRGLALGGLGPLDEQPEHCALAFLLGPPVRSMERWQELSITAAWTSSGGIPPAIRFPGHRLHRLDEVWILPRLRLRGTDRAA